MALSVRGGLSGNSGTTGVSSFSPSMTTGWTGSAPSVGDFIAIVVMQRQTVGATTWSQSAGTAWTIQPGSAGEFVNVSGGSSNVVFYTTAWDGTSPTFNSTRTQAGGWSMVALFDNSAISYAVDIFSADLNTSVTTTSITPNSATAANSGEAAIVFSAYAETTQQVTGITLTAPASYTIETQETAGGGVSNWAYCTATMHNLSVGPGSVAPGAITLSQTGIGTTYTLLVKENLPALASPQINPGQTWKRRFWHRQHLPLPLPPGTPGTVQPLPTSTSLGTVVQRNIHQRNRANVGAADGLPLVPGSYFDGPDQQGGVGGGVGLFTYFNGGQIQEISTGGVVHQRDPRQRHRASVGNASTTANGQASRAQYNGTVQPYCAQPNQRARTQRIRALINVGMFNWETATQPNFYNGKIQSRTAQPNQRAKSQISRAKVGTNASCADGVEIFTYYTGGQTQPVSAQPHQRDLRQRHRGSVGNQYLAADVEVSTAQNNGQVQPQPTRQPRRTVSRAYVRFTPVTTTNLYYGTVQPVTTRQPPRRTTSRAVWRTTTQSRGPNGTSQPWSTIPTPRRKASRAITAAVAGPPLGYVPTNPPSTIFTNLSPGVGTGQSSSMNQTVVVTGPPGTVQPEPTRQPRRTSARAYIRFTPVTTTNLYNGSVQPRATVPVPRRYPSRAVVRRQGSTTDLYFGTVQPQPTRQPRRTSARAYIRFTPVTTTNLYYGSVQPRSTVPVPRRYPSRAVWRSIIGVAQYNGQVQPLPTRQPRRTSARAFIKFKPVTTTNLYNGSVQPQPTRQPRRTSSRGVWRSITQTRGPSGTVQPLPTHPTARRVTSRAVVHSFAAAATTAISGTVQSLATRQPRRRAARAFIARTPLALSIFPGVSVSSGPLEVQWLVTAGVSSSPVEIQWNVGAPGPGRDQDLQTQNIIYNVDQNPHMSTQNVISMMPEQPKMVEQNQISMQE